MIPHRHRQAAEATEALTPSWDDRPTIAQVFRRTLYRVP